MLTRILRDRGSIAHRGDDLPIPTEIRRCARFRRAAALGFLAEARGGDKGRTGR
jgi:hypothetical protein